MIAGEVGVEEERPEKERKLYPVVKNYFIKQLGCIEKFSGYAESKDDSAMSLKLFGSNIQPDVWGLKRVNDKTKVIIAEGKLDFKSSSFDICKGQGLSRRRFADVVYLFFSKKSWDDLKKHDNYSCKEILEECKYFGLGLLLVDKDECERLINPEIEKSAVAIHPYIEPTPNRKMEVKLKAVFKKKPLLEKILLQLILELTKTKREIKYTEIRNLIGKNKGKYYDALINTNLNLKLVDEGIRPKCQMLFGKGYLEIKKESGDLLIFKGMTEKERKSEKDRNLKQKLNDSFILTQKGKDEVASKQPILLDLE